jgi:predicted RNase H-like HicB family nuclease
MKYAVVIEQAPANHAVYVPDLPGCIATGATKDDVLRNIRQAIEMHLEALRDDRQPVPEPTTTVAEVEVH